MRNKIVTSTIGVCLALLVCRIVGACVISYPTVEVRHKFRVLVSDRGGPVVGLRVELSSRVEKFTAETDKDGYAFFDNLKPGSFLLRPEFDPVWPDTVIVDVSPSGPADVTVPLTWPGRAPVTVGALKGILRGPHFYPSFGQGPFSMVLVEGIS